MNLFRRRIKFVDRYMGAFLQERVRIAECLREPHQRYVTAVSIPEAAISLELACVLMHLCEVKRPSLLLDTGSGFSSYVFRCYQADRLAAGEKIEVYSCDDSEDWLLKTEEFLGQTGLSVANLVSWGFLKQNMPNLRFDLILHDLGNPSTRCSTMREVVDSRAQDGIVVLDDVHKPMIHKTAFEVVREGKFVLEDVQEYTTDGFGRYSWCIVAQR